MLTVVKQVSLWEGQARPEAIEPSALFVRRRRIADEDAANAIEHLPRGTYYPVDKLLYRNFNSTRFMVQ